MVLLSRGRKHVESTGAGLGYKRVLVAVAEGAECEPSVDAACRLAAEKGAALHAVAVIEVPALLPLDAHMTEEEIAARRLLEHAQAIADSYGVRVSTEIARGRDAATVILEQAQADASQLIVLGAAQQTRDRLGGRLVGKTAEHVLKQASCRVLLVRTKALAPTT
jgi:nucleotide-binding universal stress UspA family protein